MSTETAPNGEKIVIYTNDYCGQALLLAQALAGVDAEIEWRDVMDGEPLWQDELRSLARGYLSVPTVVFPDGTVMVEPWPRQVLHKLGVKREGLLARLFGRRHAE